MSAAQRLAEALGRSSLGDNYDGTAYSPMTLKYMAQDLLAADPELATALETGLAWAAAEAALPEGWDGPEMKHEQKHNGRGATPMYGPEREWIAYAWLPERSGASAFKGSTPIEALQNLARALTEKLASQTGDQT